MGKANGSRECAPDDKLRVPTGIFSKKVGTAQARLCPTQSNNQLPLNEL
jgi:hypothetical protein